MNNLVIIFAKWPRQGKTKTRISKEKGLNFSYDLSVCCLDDLIANINKKNNSFDLIFATSTYEDKLLFEDKYGIKTIVVTEGSDIKSLEISIKFNYLFSKLLTDYGNVILIPMDVPFITSTDLDVAFSKFNSNKFVLGPENNGGVYLIGISGFYEYNYFEKVPWSTKNSFLTLLSNFGNEKTFVLDFFDDLNTFDDLKITFDRIKLNCPRVFNLIKCDNELKIRNH